MKNTDNGYDIEVTKKYSLRSLFKNLKHHFAIILYDFIILSVINNELERMGVDNQKYYII